MTGLTKALTYVIAANLQAVGWIILAWWSGDYLNEHKPIAVDWHIITFLIAILGVAQTFYVIIRAAFRQQKAEAETKSGF